METIRPSGADAEVKIDLGRCQQPHGGTVQANRRAVKRRISPPTRLSSFAASFPLPARRNGPPAVSLGT
jgi:hypothetical protein